jgi:hypothetical protein
LSLHWHLFFRRFPSHLQPSSVLEFSSHNAGSSVTNRLHKTIERYILQQREFPWHSHPSYPFTASPSLSSPFPLPFSSSPQRLIYLTTYSAVFQVGNPRSTDSLHKSPLLPVPRL